MSEPYLGMICIYPYTFAPRGWAFCAGQILPIAQNTALFSLLGTTFGGNGQTTFALPDLRGRFPVGAGQGPGLQNYDLGQVAGSENATLLASNIPPHSHSLNAFADAPTSSKPAGNFLAGASAYNATSDGTQLNAAAIQGPAGGPQPFGILSPYLGLNYCIAMQGIFPSRN